MACKGDCTCCYGACCTDGECSIQSCNSCSASGGYWQGAGTKCVDGECPCSTPADHNNCERCKDSAVVYKCAEGEICCPPSAGQTCCVGQCVECCYSEDCPEGYECVDFICTQFGNCVGDNDCADTDCCIAYGCEDIPCPTVDTLSCTWCGISSTFNASSADFGQYDNGNDCMVGGPPPTPISEVTQYWLRVLSTPDEVQEASPSPLYNYPVPGLSNPTGKTCRYVWRVWVGYGHQDSISSSLTQPTKCEGKMYYMYIDVNRCAPTGGSLTAVEDTSYNWGSWPTGCIAPCDTDADGCMPNAPSMTVTFAP